MVQHRFNRVRPCSSHPALLPKPTKLELTLDLTEEALKIHSQWKLFFSKNASLEFIPCDFIKNGLHQRDYLAWVLQGAFFSILENFLRSITLYFFYTGGYNSTERTRTSQLGLDIYNCVTGNVEMRMPKFSNDLLSIYLGPLTLSNFQMAASKPPKIRS